MTKPRQQSGFAQLSAILGISLVAGLTAFVIQNESRKGLKASVQALNQLEGFYTSEIAALKSYHDGLEAGGAEARDLKLDNDISKGLCLEGNCTPGGGPTYNLRGLKDLWTKGKVRNSSLVRRYLAGATQMISTEHLGTSTHCGTVEYSDNTIGAKTCLVTLAPPPPPPLETCVA